MKEKKDFSTFYATYMPAQQASPAAPATPASARPAPPAPAPGAQPWHAPADDSARAREITEAVVRSGIDITSGYDQWLTAGMALANDLGEAGRAFFHDLSRMSAQYAAAECDKKYDTLLRGSARAEGAKVHLASLYKMTKDAGVEMPKARREACHPYAATAAARNGGVTCVTLSPSPQTSSPSHDYKGDKNVTCRAFGADDTIDGTIGTPDSALPDDSDARANRPSTFTNLINISALPVIAQDTVALAGGDTESADTNLLGIITLASSIMPGVYGVYDRQKVYPPLYTMCVAPPASSKGHITPMREFVMPVHEEIRQDNMREMDEYQKEISANKILRKDNPGAAPAMTEPPYRSLFVPANSSSTATYQALSDNGGFGLTFETEGAVMAEALKSDYGNYLSGLCAAFHHEPITYNRRKEKEHVDIRRPRWTVFLTGYPEMVRALVPDAHTGLFSRFLFYWRSTSLVWRDVFAEDKLTLDEAYHEMGLRYLPIYHLLTQRKQKPVRFELTEWQKGMFNNFFRKLQEEQYAMLGDDIIASVRRLGLITFRIAMTLTVLHLADTDETPMAAPDTLTCRDDDFITAMTMVNKLLNHTTKIYTMMLDHDTTMRYDRHKPLSTNEQVFYSMLPQTFTATVYYDMAKQLNLTKRTAQRYMSRFINEAHLVERIKTGRFQKLQGDSDSLSTPHEER